MKGIKMIKLPQIEYSVIKALVGTLILAGLAMRTAMVELGGNLPMRVIITTAAVYFCVSSVLEAIYRK